MLFAQLLAGILLIPFGLHSLQRGSDGMNAGLHGSGEGAVMAISGLAMILSGLAMLLGATAGGVLAIVALLLVTIVWARQRRRTAAGVRPRELAARLGIFCTITLLIFAAWR